MADYVQKLPIDRLRDFSFCLPQHWWLYPTCGRLAMRKSFKFGLVLAAVMGLGLAAPLAVSPANADFITGGLSLTGGDVTNEAANTVTFVAGTSRIDNFANSGSFATVFGLVGTTPVTMLSEGTALNYSVAANFVGSNLFTGPNGLALLVSS